MKNIIEKVLLWFQAFFDFRPIRYANDRDIWSADAFFCQSCSPKKSGPTANDKLLAHLVFLTDSQQIKPIIMHDNCLEGYIDPLDKKVIKLKFRDELESTKECGNLCLEHKYQKIVLFTEPRHVRRTVKVLEKFSLEINVVDTRPLMPSNILLTFLFKNI